MPKTKERTDRWVEVEALCLCARLERLYGAAAPDQLVGLDEHPAVLRRASSLSRRRRTFGLLGFCSVLIGLGIIESAPAARRPIAASAGAVVAASAIWRYDLSGCCPA
ncbi:hypothetical protein [Caulobacter endophyticus]|uniref:hypothetical protein n=1 Tax=Caulobacter endophyticus TaxID=2172652 RepID=UPI0011B1CD4C|nr:hypothetical protein [Caulobacter endophyticus]